MSRKKNKCKVHELGASLGNTKEAGVAGTKRVMGDDGE